MPLNKLVIFHYSHRYEEKIKEDQYKDIDPKLLKDFPNIFEFLENSLEGTETWFHAAAISPFEESEGDLMLGWKDTGYVTVFDLLQVRREKFPIIIVWIE